jgi:hypothetical protein
VHRRILAVGKTSGASEVLAAGVVVLLSAATFSWRWAESRLLESTWRHLSHVLLAGDCVTRDEPVITGAVLCQVGPFVCNDRDLVGE